MRSSPPRNSGEPALKWVPNVTVALGLRGRFLCDGAKPQKLALVAVCKYQQVAIFSLDDITNAAFSPDNAVINHSVILNRKYDERLG